MVLLWGWPSEGQSHSTCSGLQPWISKEGGCGILGFAVPVASLWALPGCQENCGPVLQEASLATTLQGTFADELGLLYGYAVRQPFATKAILLQGEEGKMDGVHFCGQHRGVDALVYCSASGD